MEIGYHLARVYRKEVSKIAGDYKVVAILNEVAEIALHFKSKAIALNVKEQLKQYTDDVKVQLVKAIE